VLTDDLLEYWDRMQGNPLSCYTMCLSFSAVLAVTFVCAPYHRGAATIRLQTYVCQIVFTAVEYCAL
jgi:hypothetical protein